MRRNGDTPLRDESLFSPVQQAYRAYGLSFLSSVRIPHFPEAASPGGPDVRIGPGEIFGPGYVPPPRIQVEASPGRLLIRGVRSATILVTGGDAIAVQPLPGGDPSVIRQLLLGWALGGIFHQRALLPLHGSAICGGDGCFVFCAGSGAGKSTLAAAFLNRGFSFLDDNIALADFQNGTVFIAPGSPELRLWEGSIPALEFEHTLAGRIRPDKGKISVIARRSFRREKARLTRIFVLRRGDGPAVSFVNLTGVEKFRALLKHVFFARYLTDPGSRAGLFRPLQQLAERVPVVEIRLPGRLPPPEALCETILGSAAMQ